jgi:hypothetical protein
VPDDRLQVEVLPINAWFRVTPRPPYVVVSGPNRLPDTLISIVGSKCAVIDSDGIRLQGSIVDVEHFTPRVDVFGLLVEPKSAVDTDKELVCPAVIVIWRVITNKGP